MYSIISLPTGFVSDITANASTMVTDLSPYATLIIGVFLGVMVLSILINAIKK
jgi:hypothetical protein